MYINMSKNEMPKTHPTHITNHFLLNSKKIGLNLLEMSAKNTTYSRMTLLASRPIFGKWNFPALAKIFQNFQNLLIDNLAYFGKF